MATLQIRSKDSALTPFTGLHSPPAEEARQFKKRRLWSSDEQQLQSVAFDGLPTPPGSSGSDSSLSPSLAASSSSSVTFQRQIDPTSGQCVYVQHQPTPSLSSSCSTAPSTSASPSLSQFLIQRLDDSEALVKAEVNGLGTFLIQWSCLRDRLGLDDALEAVAAGLRKPAVEEASVVCEKILRKYCTNKCLPVHELSSLEQQEKTDRFKRWLQLKDDDLEMDQGIPVLPLSPDSTLPEISEGSPSGMQGGKSVTVLRRHGESSPAQQQQQSLSTDGGPDADGELDTPFEFDHLLPNSPQSIDEERADSNTTPVHDHSAFSVFTQANRGGPGMTRQPTLVESSPVVRATPKITYQPPHHHHERKVSWGYQPELLPPFPSTPPPSGDFFGKPRGRVASGKLDMWDAFDYSASPQYQTPGSFLSSVTATPDRGAMARQLGLFPASTSSGYAYTPGPFSR